MTKQKYQGEQGEEENKRENKYRGCKEGVTELMGLKEANIKVESTEQDRDRA